MDSWYSQYCFRVAGLQLHHKEKEWLEFSFFLVSDQCGDSFCGVSVFSFDMLFWISFLLVLLSFLFLLFVLCFVLCFSLIKLGEE